ncbi:MAG: NADH:flavin oxidoreductase [Betaproteobacteria bacterium]|nr:NADH:flavin oxidoreductase [Betaproteobacteria bacterium]
MPVTDVRPLFQAFEYRTLKLRNRIVMPAMTRHHSPDNVPGDDVRDYYARRARSIGMIITEGTCVNHPAANAYERIPFFHGEKSLAGWKKVIDAVHAEGAAIVPQLWHTGSARHPGASPDKSVPAYTPSGLTQQLEPLCHEMTEQDIADVVEAFAAAATDAQRLGCDGVQIHGAHGYLIDEFFWEKSNRRTDNYGGSMANRARFAAEIIAAIRARTGVDFPIILRWSQWKQQDYAARLVSDPRSLEAFLEPLVEAGVDIFDCSTRRYYQSEFEGSDLNLAGWVKKITGKPTITVGNVGMDSDFMADDNSRVSIQAAGTRSLDDLMMRLEAEEFDLVAVGRAILANPEWGSLVKSGDFAALKPFTKDALRQLS